MTSAGDDILSSPEAGGKVIRGSAWRLMTNTAGIAFGLVTATLLLHHLGVVGSGRYVTVMSLVSIPVAVVDAGLNVTASRTLALHADDERRALIANTVGLKLTVMPLSLVLAVAFTLVAHYPESMVVGTAIAGAGALLVSVANALLLRLTVELRNTRLGLFDILQQAVTLVGVAVLVAADAHLTPFFAVLILTGVVMIAAIPLIAGRRMLMWPRFDRAHQRALLRSALPMAIALGAGQVYFRIVIVLMSLISNTTQTGYFGGSLRAIDSLRVLPALATGIALPLLTAAARDDHARLRYAVQGLGRGTVVLGVLIVLVTLRAAEPVMAIVGGHEFRPAGAVLRIQVVALLFMMLYSIWSGALIALGRQRELILTNLLALIGVGAFAAILVPRFGAQGGAVASVLGDALLAALIYWRLSRVTGQIMVALGFLARVTIAAGSALATLLIPGVPDLAEAVLCGAVFLAVGQLIGMVPSEIFAAFGLQGRGLRRPSSTH